MRKLLYLLISIFILIAPTLYATIIKVDNESFSIENDKFKLVTNPLRMKFKGDYLEVGTIERSGLLAALFTPDAFNFDGTVFPLSLGELDEIAVKVKANKDNSFIYLKSPREVLAYSFSSKYISILEALFLKGEKNNSLYLKVNEREDIYFSRLFIAVDFKYLLSFINLDYSYELGLYTKLGLKLTYINYYITVLYGESLKGLSSSDTNIEFAFGLDNKPLSFDFSFEYGFLPTFLEQYRKMSFHYKIELKHPKINIKREGRMSLSEKGKYTKTESYALETKHYELNSDNAFYIKVDELKFGIRQGYSTLSYEWKVKKDRSVGFSITVLKEASLFIKILL